MSPTQQLTFPEDRSPERLDAYVSECLPDISRSQLKKLIDTGFISVNGHTAKASTKLRGGEILDITLPAPEPTEALPEDIPIHILYEDQDVVVIDKAAGMVVHPAAGHSGGTLVNALLHHCDDLAGIGGELRPGIVHRIDKDTSGAIVVTKNDQAHQHLAVQFKEHSVNRRYVALVHGHPGKSSGIIDQPIGRHPTQRKKMSGKSTKGKRAVTHWKVLKQYNVNPLSLVENCPLVADPLYGNRSRLLAIKDSELRKLIDRLPGQALHARSLGFIHPTSGKYLEFFSEIPDTLQDIISYLDKNSQ